MAAALGTTALHAGAALADDGSIVVARGMDINTLDPHASPIDIASQVIRNILDPLVTLDEAANIHPGIAESWEIGPDQQTYTFRIRDGLLCHDGTPFDAEAVKWNFERMARPETTGSAAIRNLDRASVDGNSITLHFNSRDPAFLTNLGALRFGMLCPTSVGADGSYRPIGTGPWKFVEWDKNDKVRLERNDTYVNVDPMIENPGAPYQKSLEFKVIPEAVARMAALRSGEVDFAEPSFEEIAGLLKDDSYKIWIAQYSGQWAWGSFTLNVPPFDDPRVRQAVVHAMDRSAYAAIAFEGLASPIYCPAPPNMPFVDQTLCEAWGQTYDPEKARSLLAEAGYGPGHPLKLVLSVHQLVGWDLMHQIMLQNLKDAGIEATLETRDAASFMSDIKGQNLRTEGVPFVWTWGSSGLDPLATYASVFTTGTYLNADLGPKFNRLVADADKLSGDERGRAVQGIMEHVLSEARVFPIVSPGWAFYTASRASTTGLVYGHMNVMKFNDVTF